MYAIRSYYDPDTEAIQLESFDLSQYINLLSPGDNLLITPEFGPHVRLRALFMDADLPGSYNFV